MLAKKVHDTLRFLVWISVVAALTVALAAGLVQTAPAAAQGGDPIWPTAGWPVSTPEEQGIDSEALLKVLNPIQQQELNINSLTVVRNGAVVMDVYQPPAGPDELHLIYSCTKSVVSILIGIAIEQGHIAGVDQRLVDFFPERAIANLDAAKESITLEDVLLMASGLDCQDSYLYNWRGLRAMRASDDWLQAMLDLPMRDEPGTRFEYCNGGTYVLSRILEATTGMETIAFAEQYLFGPLGITDSSWQVDPVGGAIAWGGLALRPHDMAKIGYLYLNGGEWDGEQIVSPEWVAASSEYRIDSGTLDDGYGYQWWVSNDDYYAALGYGGQVILVKPELNMVVVVTSGLSTAQYSMAQMLAEYAVKAAVSDEPLPPNPEGVAALDAMIQALASPEPEDVAALPEMAHTVSGRTYTLSENVWQMEAIRFDFEDGLPEAQLTITWPGEGEVEPQPVGLDGSFRASRMRSGMVIGLRGNWRDENVFELYFRTLVEPMDGVFTIRFEGDTASIWLREHVNGMDEQFTGTADS
ncbi:MAG: serine hydrolase [Anaerolineae bacterium]|nr:serine hydrolase [Anaerolineae bacterium]